jgi:hypothetical protein
LYFFINTSFLLNYHYSTFVELLVNGLFGLISIVIFLKPIKKLLG